MLASSFVYRLALALAACLTLIEGSRLHAQDVDLPESIRLALIRYADLAPLAVTWTQTTEATSTGQEKNDADVMDGIIRGGSYVQQLAFCDSKVYIRRESRGDSPWPPRTDEFAFDRNLLYAAHNLFYTGASGNGDPKDRPYLHKWLPKNDQPETSYFRGDYFRAAGVRLPARTKELVQSWHPQAELLAMLAEGGRIRAINPTNLDGCTLIRIRVTAGNSQEHDFYLDPDRGYAVRRHETWDGIGRLITRSDCTEFEQLTARSLWMPRLCRVEEYTSARARDDDSEANDYYSSPLYVITSQVNAIEVQPWPNSRFQLKYTTPGLYVNDASFPEITGKDGIFYQIPANPQRLDEVIAVRRASYQAWRNAEKKSRPLRVSFLVLNGVGLTLFALYVFVRRWRKARSA